MQNPTHAQNKLTAHACRHQLHPLDADRQPEGCCGGRGSCVDIGPTHSGPSNELRGRSEVVPVDDLFQTAAMLASCYSKPADSGSKRSSVAKLLLGVFVVYMLHTAWLLYGFLNTRPCDRGRGERCISSYLTARPRLQVRLMGSSL